MAEDLLREALDGAGVAYVEVAGRGGVLRPEDRRADHRQRPAGSSTLSTVQVDFDQPARFDLSLRGLRRRAAAGR